VQVFPEEHAEHVAPLVPHEEADSAAYASHVPLTPPLQHPFAHVLLSHAHAPIMVSQTPFPHVAHAPPPLPHRDADSTDSATHVEPLQHPPGHDVESHTHAPLALLHSCPAAQAAHAAPPAPHEAFASEA
jgi:hypothetical protein